MTSLSSISRRSFLALAGAAPLALAAYKAKRVPVGLELYSVRDELAKDLMGTVRAVAKMGYEVVEFFSPYYQWTPDYAKEVRKLLDDLKIRCLSTHNGPNSFTSEGIQKAIELNQILGAKYIVLASAGAITSHDGWKGVAERLTHASEKLKPLNMRAGYHNHKLEFVPLEGKRPMETLAANTPKDVMLQLDVGTCVEAGSDPVAWIKANPGRINSLHCKEWGAGDGRGYSLLFGEGEAPWLKIFEAAESVGGVQYYLIEQEGSRYPALETAERCLASFKKLRA
ncbi:MAG: sugar phosphate isomerase/epimerase [Blastocatellia bacterium]|nr:sugar phosphate isomerase/epimerase [Blastocatellia bacterium]